RVQRHTEVTAGLAAGMMLEQRNKMLLNGAGEDRAAHDDDVIVVPGCQRGSDVPADALDVLQVQAAVAMARSSDADDAHIASGYGSLRVGRRGQPAGFDAVANPDG